jgi:hypothetical protein
MDDHREPYKPREQHQKPDDQSLVDLIEWRDDVDCPDDEKKKIVEDGDPQGPHG